MESESFVKFEDDKVLSLVIDCPKFRSQAVSTIILKFSGKNLEGIAFGFNLFLFKSLNAGWGS